MLRELARFRGEKGGSRGNSTYASPMFGALAALVANNTEHYGVGSSPFASTRVILAPILEDRYCRLSWKPRLPNMYFRLHFLAT